MARLTSLFAALGLLAALSGPAAAQVAYPTADGQAKATLFVTGCVTNGVAAPCAPGSGNTTSSAPSGTVGNPATGAGAASPVYDAATGLGLLTAGGSVKVTSGNVTVNLGTPTAPDYVSPATGATFPISAASLPLAPNAATASNQANATGSGTLALGTAGSTVTIANTSDATARVALSGVTGTGAVVGFQASDNPTSALYVVGATNGAANTRYTSATADGSYTFNIAGRSRVVLTVTTAAGTASNATVAYSLGVAAGLVSIDASPAGPLPELDTTMTAPGTAATTAHPFQGVPNGVPVPILETNLSPNAATAANQATEITAQQALVAGQANRVTLTQTQVAVPANTSTLLLAANSNRKSLRIAGTNSTDSFRLGYGGPAAATSSALFGSGGVFTAEQYGPGDGVPTGAIYGFSTTAFTAQVGEGN